VTRKTIAGITVLALVIVAAWYLLLWAPEGTKLSAATARGAKAEAQQPDLQSRLISLEELKVKLPSLLAERRRFEAAVPSGSQLPGGLSGIDAAATKSGVVVGSLTPSASPSTGTGAALSELAVSISATGSYGETMNFIFLLNAMPRLFVLRSVGLTPGQKGQLSATLSGDLFYQSQPAGSPA
jgi:Tfp pilus assembly protein PilO